jgi:hypothetical protein
MSAPASTRLRCGLFRRYRAGKIRSASALLVLAALAAWPSFASAAEWRSQQPVAAGIGVPTTIGEIGDVEFWAPDRGMLITAGNEGVGAGLFAFDGSGWYRYATVCGGHEGRIAYAGPNDFWTISDQQAGQETGAAAASHISLCHFIDGAVVASYAEPLGVAGSYLPMSAAACGGPSDCWFAGERLPGSTNVGAFHLHWNGSTLTPIPALTESQPEIEDPGRSVTALAFHEGTFYESVAIREDDEPLEEEAETEASSLHQIFSGGGPLSFVPFYLETGAPVAPDQLEGLHLSGDGAELWAVAGAAENSTAAITALRLGEAGFEAVPLQDPEAVFLPGDRVGGLAAEPGSGGAWLSFRRQNDFPGSEARLAWIGPEGTVERSQLLPGLGAGIGPKGPAGPLACPAAGQCWLATEQGWLFHLGPDLPRNGDPALHALVTYRPPDASLPAVPPTSLPLDDSGAAADNSQETPEVLEEPLPRRKPPVLSGIKQRIVAGHVLEMSFVLHAKARVQLVAKRQGSVVAKTAQYTMAKGKRSLRLALDPRRWPTKLDLRVHALKGKSK